MNIKCFYLSLLLAFSALSTCPSLEKSDLDQLAKNKTIEKNGEEFLIEFGELRYSYNGNHGLIGPIREHEKSLLLSSHLIYDLYYMIPPSGRMRGDSMHAAKSKFTDVINVINISKPNICKYEHYLKAEWRGNCDSEGVYASSGTMNFYLPITLRRHLTN